MNTSKRWKLAVVVWLTVNFGALAWAQDSDAARSRDRSDEKGSPESQGTATTDAVGAESGTRLREAMVTYFARGLRRELALNDRQIAHVLPRVEELERTRTRTRRERTQVLRQLRRSYQNGAEDAELLELMGRIENLELKGSEEQRRLQREVDSVLSPRQQVEFRMFTQRFRKRLQERIGQLRSRGEHGDDGALPRPGRRRKQRDGGASGN